MFKMKVIMKANLIVLFLGLLLVACEPISQPQDQLLGDWKKINDENRLRYDDDSLYLKSPEEMWKLFKDVPEAIENTNRIAERCNVNLEFNKYKLPKYKIDGNLNAFEYLKSMCEKNIYLR